MRLDRSEPGEASVEGVIQELEARRGRAERLEGGLHGWGAGNAYGLGEAIVLLQRLSTQQPATSSPSAPQSVLSEEGDR